jgi:hypothetical protein
MAQIGGAFNSIKDAASTVAGKVADAFTPPPSMAPIASLPAIGRAVPAAAPSVQFAGKYTPKAELSVAEMADASKHCKFALSALQYVAPTITFRSYLQLYKIVLV